MDATTTRTKPLTKPMTTALVVGNMIGSGVFLLPASLAAYGPISLIGWLFTAAGAFLLALVFARLGRAMPRTGGPYAFSREAFGDFVGFQTAWGYWIAAWVGNAAIAIAFVGYLGHFFPVLSANATSDKVMQAVIATAAIWLLTWVNSRGLRQSGVMQLATTVLKVLPLGAVALLGLFWMDAGNFSPFNTSGESPFGAVTAVATLTLWAFIGLESATVPAEGVDDAERTIPRSTVRGLLITAGIYVLGTVAVMGILPAEILAASTAPFAEAAALAWGSLAGDVVALAAVISAFGCLNGWILIQGQVPYAAARDGLFPKTMGELNRHGVPARALTWSSLLLTALMLVNYNASLVQRFTDMILLATLATLVPYVFTAAAQMYLLTTKRHRYANGHPTRDMAVALAAFVYAAWTIVGAGYQAVAWGYLLLLAGMPVFVWIRRGSTEIERVIEIADSHLVLDPDDPVRTR